MDKFKIFKNLHYQNQPFLLGNVWNAQSALLFQRLRFKAIGTSSGAIATSLGYEDGEKMPFGDLLRIVKNIQSKIDIPLTVDIEGGYNRNIAELINNIIALQKLGVIGINIEDSITNTEREIVNAQIFGQTIQKIKSHLSRNNINIFLNVRTDFYIMGLENQFEETIKRIKIYEENGADGIFVPCIVQENEIKKVVESTALPLNVMCMPGLPNFKNLKKSGVKRISIGPFLYNDMIKKLENSINDIVDNQSFNSIFA
ncbi:Probable carboxyvinyl-carboxyphosphonate phosphorylmutase [hydrothermal vent metagenome]|uniref:Probable carboxyvinyl-carboxyphosphonate phosphorylmutase n=1 Tax=hydrothermal vent metagenome TaxID=652676 RepID=A0A3B0T3Q5_9ZZZZ